jgi:hypothetical protein
MHVTGQEKGKIYCTGPSKLATIPLYNPLKSPWCDPVRNAFVANKPLLGQVGGGNLDFFGPQMALS